MEIHIIESVTTLSNLAKYGTYVRGLFVKKDELYSKRSSFWAFAQALSQLAREDRQQSLQLIEENCWSPSVPE